MKFWRLVSKHPDVAFTFMMRNSDTFAFDSIEKKVDKSIYSSGPFYFIYCVKFTVYANPSSLEAKQAEFIEMFK